MFMFSDRGDTMSMKTCKPVLVILLLIKYNHNAWFLVREPTPTKEPKINT
jgi:hypothetical protein